MTGVLVSASLAFAGVEVLYGNTVELTTITPEGESTMQLFYNPDGTVVTDDGKKYTWNVTDDKFCTQFTFVPKNGEALRQNACSPLSTLDGAAPGDTWEASPSEGVTIKGKIIAGR